MFITIEDFYANLEEDKSSAARLVFADWLEEQGDERADLIREIEKIEPMEFWKIRGLTSKTLFSAKRLKTDLRNDFAIDVVEQILPRISIPNLALEAYQWLQDMRGEEVMGTDHDLIVAIGDSFNNIYAYQNERVGHYIPLTLTLIATHKFYLAHHGERDTNYVMDNIIANVAEIHYHHYRKFTPQSWWYWKYPACRLLEYFFFNKKHLWTLESPYAKILSQNQLRTHAPSTNS